MPSPSSFQTGANKGYFSLALSFYTPFLLHVGAESGEVRHAQLRRKKSWMFCRKLNSMQMLALCAVGASTCIKFIHGCHLYFYFPHIQRIHVTCFATESVLSALSPCVAVFFRPRSFSRFKRFPTQLCSAN